MTLCSRSFNSMRAFLNMPGSCFMSQSTPPMETFARRMSNLFQAFNPPCASIANASSLSTCSLWFGIRWGKDEPNIGARSGLTRQFGPCLAKATASTR